jgi:hypothetical protein
MRYLVRRLWLAKAASVVIAGEPRNSNKAKPVALGIPLSNNEDYAWIALTVGRSACHKPVGHIGRRDTNERLRREGLPRDRWDSRGG